MIDAERVDYIRVPVTDMDEANHFYGELLGLRRNPNSPSEDWVEYEAGNVTLAVMTPHTHDYEFTALPPSTIALRVRDVADAKAKLEAAGLEVGEMWDSGLCKGAGVTDPAGNRILLHRRYGPYPDGDDAVNVERVDFVSVLTQDMPRAKRFYTQVLGLEVETEGDSDLELRCGQVTLDVFDPSSIGQPFAVSPAGLALRVEDVDAARTELEGKGVEFDGETIETGVCRQAWFKDPDGNALMLHRRFDV